MASCGHDAVSKPIIPLSGSIAQKSSFCKKTPSVAEGLGGGVCTRLLLPDHARLAGRLIDGSEHVAELFGQYFADLDELGYQLRQGCVV